MAAPSGNQFWKLRSKHGRDKLFATPELLWEAACEYFQWCDDNPLLEHKVINSSKEGVVNHTIPKMRAYTMQGICLYLNCNVGYFNDFEKNVSEDDKDFSLVITCIRETIYNQKFSGAAADLLNANIIARDLGLKDNTDITSNGNNVATSIPLVLQDGKTYEELKDELTPE